MSDNLRYIDEYSDDEMLTGIVIRSRIRRGFLKSIRHPELPDGYTLLRASDIPGERLLKVPGCEIPILTEDNIIYRGQPLALLAGPDERKCRSIIESMEIQYEREEPRRFAEPFDDLVPIREQRITKGDPDPAFNVAFQIIEGEYRMGGIRAGSIEPLGAFADVTGNAGTIACPSRWLFHVRRSVARALKRPTDAIRVELLEIAQATDGFLWRPSLYAVHAALLSHHTGKPVRVVVDPGDEDAHPAGPEARIYHETALDRDGRVMAMSIDITASAGAFPVFGEEFLDRLCVSASGLYRCENIRVVGRLTRPNEQPAELLSGMGFCTSHFALEVHATRLAELADEDPAQWRMKRIISEREELPTGGKLMGVSAAGLIEQAARSSDFGRKYAAYEMQKKRRKPLDTYELPLRGIGIAFAVMPGGFLGGNEPGKATVHARIDSNGKMSLFSSATLRKSSSDSAIREVTGGILSMPAEEINVVPPTTEDVPDSGPAVFSRNITVIRRLIVQCAEDLQKRRFRSPLPLEVNRSFRRRKKSVWDPETLAGNPFVFASSIVTIAEVEVDPVTLEIHIKGVWLTVDAGPVFEKAAAKNTILTEVGNAFDMMRSGESFWERSGREPQDGGRVSRETIPAVSVNFVDSKNESPGPIDGLATASFLPACTTAVSQATGFYFDTIPLTNEMIHLYVET